MSEEQSLDDVLASLEGEEAPEYKRSFGIEEGTYDMQVQDAVLDTLTFPSGVTVPVATFTVELQEAPYRGFKREVQMFLGQNTKTKEWQDGQFRTSVRRLLPDDVFEKKIAKLSSPVARYKAAIEEIKGRTGRINFRKRKYEDKETGEEKITDSAYPVGAFLSPTPTDSSTSDF